MTEYINLEAEVDFDSEKDDIDEQSSDSGNSFIDYQEIGNEADFYRLNYLTREQITYIERHLINMLRDIAFEVTKRKCRNILGQMFSIESALAKKTLLKWFNLKFKRQFEKLKPFKKWDLKGKIRLIGKKINA